MKKIVMAIALASIGFTATQAMAQEQSPWQVRARLVNIAPANGSDPVAGVGAADRISVDSKEIPEVDFTYYFTPNWSAELILTYPQKHDVKLDGVIIGSFKHLPPTLTAQYHFAPDAKINPYIGAGINYTRISDVNLLKGTGDLENSSVGLAVQAGIDFKLDKNWSLNLDVKKVQIRSDVMINGSKVSAVKVDPWLVGIGVGYRF
ncbi:OmpW family outer membrane protein [Undibacterium sp. TS12]|uniref:OmpW/AlkL family protein n=1 Tax=Undibacterium sp. TS12 TaxID=2908202 RepID=UPI001F4D0F69|nr:OmpW family outer membrane protein [Undibacterium sp. TS12]MCH8617994.1 outer membrane beta-barrel protein [Undibacterium sp. TS12]